MRNSGVIFSINHIKNYVLPVVGDVAISDLTKMHLQMIISENAAHPRTCQLIWRTFLQIAESAVDDRYLPEAALRPLKSVQLPKYQKRILSSRRRETPRDPASNAVIPGRFHF